MEIAGIGIDTWGVDYGYLDEDGRLISNPFCYRDPKNAKAMDEMDVVHPFKEFYEIAGLQKMDFNTAYQVYYDVQHRHYILDCAKTFLFMPDLFAYFLTGRKACEYSIASTSQMLDARTKKLVGCFAGEDWHFPGILPEIVEPGTVLGELDRMRLWKKPE
ncbi:MAG: FGGY family carbohydrate kinase [Clostridia bacterium]